MRRKPIILVVDDIPLNRRILRIALERFGFDVLEACDGAEALAALASCPADLVLMDCQMPIMDGLMATEKIRARRCQTPIIAYTTGDNRDECLRVGMNDYLCKPAPLSALKGKLEFWLGQAA